MVRVLLTCSLLGSLGCTAKPAEQGTSTPAQTQAQTQTQTKAQAQTQAQAQTPGETDALDPTTAAWLRTSADAVAHGPSSGSSKDNPLPACGARGSYSIVADLTCEDGSRPLDSDISRAADSRRGNVGPGASGHIIDLYEVPCPEGPQKIYVDMYDCDHARPSRSELEVQYYIHDIFLAGEFERFARRCEQELARGPDRVSLMLQACIPAMPIALRELGKPEEATAWLAKYCADAPDPSKRHGYLASVLDAHEVLRERQGRPSERSALTADLARVCAVDPAAFAKWLADEGS